MHRAFAFGAILAFAMVATTADAASCRNGKGKIIKCRTPSSARLCLDKTGKKMVKMQHEHPGTSPDFPVGGPTSA